MPIGKTINCSSPIPVCGVYFTVSDLFKWAEAMRDHKIINLQSTDALSETFGTKEGSLGEAKPKDDSLGLHIHQGSGNSYEALLYGQAKDSLTIILMTNNQNFKVNQLKDAIVNILYGKPYTVPKNQFI